MENNKVVINKLNMIQADVAYIKEHLEDINLTEDDLLSLNEAKKDLKEGKTKRLLSQHFFCIFVCLLCIF